MALALALANLSSKITDNLNFFRIHVLFFTFTPLIFSGIFYAANGATHVPYVDALFLCFSAGTVCGLATVDLSALTGFQQAILFVQSAIGNPVVASWVMVYIRKCYFNKRLQYIVEAEIAKRKALAEQRAREEGGREKLLRRFTNVFTMRPSMQGTRTNVSEDRQREGDEEKASRKQRGPVRADAIRRTSAALRRIDPNGIISQPVPEEEPLESTYPSQTSTLRNDRPVTDEPVETTHTVTFRDQVRNDGHESHDTHSGDDYFGLRAESPAVASSYRPSVDIIHDDRTYIPPGGAPLRRRTTIWSHRTQTQRSIRDTASVHEPAPPPVPVAKNRGYGGFPYPTTFVYHLLRNKALPGARRSLERGVTLLPERTRTVISRIGTRHSEKNQRMSPVQYFSESFNALIGRNSKFYDLTEENLEELGGVEYRALNALLWIIAIYHFGTQLICFTIVAPYMSISRWAPAFSPPNLHRDVSPVWYSAFQVTSAYTTLGMSLVDQSMVPFQEAYPLIFACTFLIFAGNLAFPIFLRFFIWFIMKFSPSARLCETLHFLLDHPRRCYIYLFPSHQTWLLLGVVLILNGIDWFLFLLLNIDIPTFEAIPLGVRFAIGLLQSTSARAAGFSTVSISSLAPALQVAFVIVMYLGVYPIALSVQSTNVYEEKSLGVFEEEDDDDEMEPKVEGSKPSSVGRYLAWHARRQLSFDMWWLGLVLFLLCVIERGKIRNSENFEWFTIFALIFEIISAYSGCGMSLGVPFANYSFSGAFTPLSKVIMASVMLRGRHRGLPVAIDRAVMLPFEFKKAERAVSGEGQVQNETAGDADGDNISIINRFIDENGEVRKKRG